MTAADERAGDDRPPSAAADRIEHTAAKPDGRHGPGLDKFDRQLEKGAIATMRNWNTIPKVLT